MRVLVCGSREWKDPEPIKQWLGDLLAARAADEVVVIHGACRGADLLVAELAEARGIHCAAVRALWERDRGAGRRRNAAMVRLLEPHRVVAFSLGTPGTQGTIDLARAAGIPVVVFGHEAVAV